MFIQSRAQQRGFLAADRNAAQQNPVALQFQMHGIGTQPASVSETIKGGRYRSDGRTGRAWDTERFAQDVFQRHGFQGFDAAATQYSLQGGQRQVRNHFCGKLFGKDQIRDDQADTFHNRAVYLNIGFRMSGSAVGSFNWNRHSEEALRSVTHSGSCPDTTFPCLYRTRIGPEPSTSLNIQSPSRTLFLYCPDACNFPLPQWYSALPSRFPCL